MPASSPRAIWIRAIPFEGWKIFQYLQIFPFKLPVGKKIAFIIQIKKSEGIKSLILMRQSKERRERSARRDIYDTLSIPSPQIRVNPCNVHYCYSGCYFMDCELDLCRDYVPSESSGNFPGLAFIIADGFLGLACTARVFYLRRGML